MDGRGQMRALYKVLVWKPERKRGLRYLVIPFTTVIDFVPVPLVNTRSLFRVIYVGGPCSVRYPTSAMIHI
jgi:hypothetical protein